MRTLATTARCVRFRRNRQAARFDPLVRDSVDYLVTSA